MRRQSRTFKVALLKSDDAGPDYVLLEGNKAAFEYLAKLFLTRANARDCGFQISPHGAGSALFKRGSEFGLYLHRLPCKGKRPRPH